MRELGREFAAHAIRVKDAHRRDVIKAWRQMRIEILTGNTKKLPALQSLFEDEGLSEKPAPKVQSYEEQKAALQMLSGMFGGKIIQLERSA